jgi:DHA2 family methylenomycin A resistance protein-like MFS transporter
VLNLSGARQGLGAALVVSSSLAILYRNSGNEITRLAKAVGLWTAAGGVSIAAGPMLGGLLLTVAGWRSVFWVNLPVCTIGFWLTMKSIPQAPGKTDGSTLDLPGQLLAIVALTATTGAVIEFQSLGLSHPLVFGGLAVALAAGTGFYVVEKKVSTPMLPLGIFSRTGFSSAVLFGVLVNFSYYGVIFVLSLYLQKVRGYSAIGAGLAFLPLTGTFIFSNVASGWVMTRHGLRRPMFAGALVAAAGYAMLGIIGTDSNSGFWSMLPGLALIPMGMGLAVPAMTTSILSSVEKDSAGTASAILNAARQVGGAMGVAICGALAGTEYGLTGGIHSALAVSTCFLLVAATLALRSGGMARLLPVSRSS